MNTIFAIALGEYSDYHIHSVWSAEKDAVKAAELLNRASRYKDYVVQEFPFNTMPERHNAGYTVTYDYLKHGYSVDVKNIVAEESVFSTLWEDENMAREQGTNLLIVHSKTLDQAYKSIFDAAAKLGAKAAGIV